MRSMGYLRFTALITDMALYDKPLVTFMTALLEVGVTTVKSFPYWVRQPDITLFIFLLQWEEWILPDEKGITWDFFNIAPKKSGNKFPYSKVITNFAE